MREKEKKKKKEKRKGYPLASVQRDDEGKKRGKKKKIEWCGG